MCEETIENARILIVDYQQANALYLQAILRKSGFVGLKRGRWLDSGRDAVSL